MLVQDNTVWNATKESKNARKEIEELYAWWQESKKDATEKSSTFKEGHDNYVKGNEMLKRLVDIRMYMWTWYEY